MTIKPVSVAPKGSTKRVVNSSSVDAEGKKDAQVVGSNAGVDQSVVVSRESHRNVVIDGHGHGQSPQRRGEVYDEIPRKHRCSPLKSTRSKRRDLHDHHHHHHKRERVERVGDKHNLNHAHSLSAVGSGTNKCGSPHLSVGTVAGNAIGAGGNGAVGNPGVSVVNNSQSPELLSSTKNQGVQTSATNVQNAAEETYSGYNSGDEHLQPKEVTITVEEWQRRDDEFAKRMVERGYELKNVEEDGACLFRSISLQIYGDEGMHDIIRQHTMDYIQKNREYFSQFVTEDINSYIKRKRRKDSHGNHIEIQAMSEIYSRPVEVYCYESTPINIFNSEQSKNGYPPLRLSYQRTSHYNAIIDPYNATVGIGLGLAGYKPEIQTKEAARVSEQLEIEQTMFEDKLKTTDWEATNEAIEEQIARESYLQWCRDNIQRSRATADTTASTSATVTSANAGRSDCEASPSKYSLPQHCSGGGGGGGGNGGNGGVGASGGNSAAASAAVDSAIAIPAQNTGNAGHNAVAVATGGLSPKDTHYEHKFATLSSKSLSQLAHNLKKREDASELGYDSDATDRSSASSVGHCVGGAAGNGGMSPTNAAGQRGVKKAKNRRNCNNLRMGRKRRHEPSLAANTNAEKSNCEVLDVPMRKSPKQQCDDYLESSNLHAHEKSRGSTPEAEQLPSTSKQSHTPDKCLAQDNTTTAPTCNIPKQNYSSFYQELLEASYATDAGFSEAEMLNRAIQMSTQDYIDDQKRKYLFYGP